MGREQSWVLLNAVVADGDSVSKPIDRYTTMTYDINIAGSATCTIYTSVDNGVNWEAETAATSSESATINITAKNKVKATVSSWASGAVTCAISVEDVDQGEDLSVPAADTTSNVTMSEVVGNKDDTTAGTSIVSLVKVVDGVADAILVDTTAIEVDTTSIETKVDTIDGIVDAILVDTTAIEVDTTSIETKVDTVDTVVDGIAVQTTSIETKVDTVDTVVDGIAVQTTAIEVDTTSIETKVDTVDTVVDGLAAARTLGGSFSSLALTASPVAARAIGSGTPHGFVIQRPITDTASTYINVGDASVDRSTQPGVELAPGERVCYPSGAQNDTYNLANWYAVASSASATNTLDITKVTGA